MTTYDLTFCKGHALITTLDGMVLVDTGSQKSFSANGQLYLCGELMEVPTSIQNIDASYLSIKVGTSVCGLLGMDILSKKVVLIDYPHRRLCLDYEGAPGLEAVSFTSFGLPGVELRLKNQMFKFILDTGSPVSYAPAWLLKDFEEVGNVEDFSPLTTTDIFSTPLYEVDTRCGETSFTGTYGILPDRLAVLVTMTGMDGIVGKCFLDTFAVVLKAGKVFLI